MTKKWYQSKTIWGIIIAALGAFLSQKLQVPDVTLPDNADYQTLKTYADSIKSAQGDFNVIIANVIGVLGSIFAIYGRIKAGEKLTK